MKAGKGKRKHKLKRKHTKHKIKNQERRFKYVKKMV